MKKTLLSLAGTALLLGALHAALRGGRRPEPAPAPSRIVSDTGGRLREVSLHFVPEATYAFPILRDFLTGLEPGVRLSFLVKDEEAERALRARLAEWGVPNPIRVSYLRQDLTPWGKDRLLATDRILWAPPEPHRGGVERENEWRAPWALGGRGVDVRIAPFRFEGGDFVATRTHVFATEVLVSRNPDLDRAELRRRVEEVCGRKLVLIEGEVPYHHVGMVMTPIDEQTIVVGEAKDGDMKRKLDHVAATLEREGFRVVRIPLIPTGEDFVYITYNNAVMSGKTIWIPTYGLETDAVAIETYRSLGLDVRPVDARGVYTMGGTLRCLITVLSRDE